MWYSKILTPKVNCFMNQWAATDEHPGHGTCPACVLRCAGVLACTRLHPPPALLPSRSSLYSSQTGSLIATYRTPALHCCVYYSLSISRIQSGVWSRKRLCFQSAERQSPVKRSSKIKNIYIWANKKLREFMTSSSIQIIEILKEAILGWGKLSPATSQRFRK